MAKQQQKFQGRYMFYIPTRPKKTVKYISYDIWVLMTVPLRNEVESDVVFW